MIRGYQANIQLIPSASNFNLVDSWRRQPIGNVTFQEPFEASHDQWRMDGILANAVFPSANIVAVTLHGRHPTWSSIYLSLHLHHSAFLYKLDFTSQNIIHPKASNIFEVLLKFFLLSHLSVFVTKKDFFSHVWVGGYVTTRKESTSKDHMPSQKFKYRRKRLLVMAYGPRRPSYLHLSLKEILWPYLRK